MLVRFKLTRDQRHAVRANLARLQASAAAGAALRTVLPAHFTPNKAATSVESVHPDRFVLRVRLSSDRGEERTFALKVYRDKSVERVWAHAQELAKHHQPDPDGLCLPFAYVPEERMLVLPWIE